MNERPTPETDSATYQSSRYDYADLSRIMERERDEAREIAKKYEGLYFATLAQRDELLTALERAHRKMQAYVGVCAGDKELTDTVLPMTRAAIAAAKGGKQ